MAGTARIPVILDTDIGSDIDDTWALAMLLNSPELDLKLVTTATGDTTRRAKIVAKLLRVANRPDVAVGVGVERVDQKLSHGEWSDDYDLAGHIGPVHRDGVAAMIDTIMASPSPITLVCIGPLPNVAEALTRQPRIASKVRFVGMHGSVYVGYGGKPEISKEWNVVADAPSCQKVFTAPWDMTITPVDSCSLVRLTGEKYQAVRRSKNPLAKAVIENYDLWRHGKPDNDASSILFDTVAVYLAFADNLLQMKRLGIRVTDDGFTVPDPAAKQMNVAVGWKNMPAFEDLLVGRLC